MDSDSRTVNVETANFTVDTAKITQISELVCRALGVGHFELSISLVESETIQELNSTYRHKDYPTDVLSFPQTEFSEPLALLPEGHCPLEETSQAPATLGDVVISLPEAVANAHGIGQGLDREVCFLLIHGILHLCGHDHEVPEEEQRMLALQDALMERINQFQNPPLWQQCVQIKEF